MSAIRDKFLARVYSGQSKDIDPEIINATSLALKNGMIEGFGSDFKDIPVDSKDFEMLANLEQSVYSFSAAKNYHELKQLTDLITDSSGAIRPFSEFRAEAEKVFKNFNEDWLSTEYGTAINGAMGASRWVDYTKNKKAMPYLRYVTAGDSRVRDSHRSLDGVVKRIDDNFWNSYYPPNGYNCRCTTTQTGQSKETPEGSISYPSVNPMFKVNLAKHGLIFPKDHPYYNGVPKEVLRKSLAYLPPENTYRTIKIDADKFIEVHPLHGDDELTKNIEASRLVLKFEPSAKINLHPILNEKEEHLRSNFYPKDSPKHKNADTSINGLMYDYKEPVNLTKSAIQNAIKDGKEKCKRIIIILKDSDDFNFAKNVVNGQLKHYKNGEIEEVWLMNHKERIILDGKAVIKQKQALPK